MKAKKLVALILAMVMSLSLIACGGKEEAPAAKEETKTEAPAKTDAPAKEEKTSLLDKPMTFKLCYTENPDTAVGTIMPATAEKIKELTNGEIIFECYPSSQLGTNAEVMEQIVNGAPMITAAGYDNMSAFVDSCTPLSIPYVFENINEVCAFYDTDYFKSVEADMIAAGYKPLCAGSLGVRHFISTFPITQASDIKGHIVRMGAANSVQSFVTVMDGTPATTAWADNYSLLQSGAIEACEASIDLLYSSSLYEVCDYLCLSGHLSTPFMFVMSPTFWDQIPAEYQEIILTAMGEAMDELAAKLQADAASYVEKFKEAGVTVCEDPDIASFAEYVPVLFEYLGIDPNVYNDIRAAIDSVT